MPFADRVDAGRKLAEKLAEKYQGKNGVVYALPRGGVVLGAEIARALHMPLDVIIARKIGHPANPEYAVAAVTVNGDTVIDPQAIETISIRWLRRHVAAEREEAQRRRQLYLRDRSLVSASGRIAILVDDGIATGLTIEAAIRELRRQRPARLVLAVPIAPVEAVARLAKQVDDVVVLEVPGKYLGSIGSYYEDFPPLSDDQVIALLDSLPMNRPRHSQT